MLTAPMRPNLFKPAIPERGQNGQATCPHESEVDMKRVAMSTTQVEIVDKARAFND